MTIPFTCPHCAHETNVADQYAGQTGPCASCGNTITIPPAPGAVPTYKPAKKTSAGPMIAIILVGALVALLVCGGILAALLLPAVQAAREAARRAQCTNNLKQIGLAMHNYHDTYKCFPAAVLTDEDGRPWRSWRVAILPFIEQQPLYDQYDFSEPWDGPNNLTLHGIPIPAYRCPSDPGGPASAETSYVMILGAGEGLGVGTIGGYPNETVKMSDVRDGTSNTILAIEVGASGIPWIEPRDVTVDEAVTFLTNPQASPFEQLHPGGANVLLADGSVLFLAETTDPAMVRNMLTRDDGQAVNFNF